MMWTMARHPGDMFLSGRCRRVLAEQRWAENGKLHVFDTKNSAVMPGTVAHNRDQLDKSEFLSSARSGRLLGPLSGLDPVYGEAQKLKVLSIGPRTEMELLHLIGLGFLAGNIHAVDLISSSPLITPGDMHALPFDNNEFDVVISSWVLNYSRDPLLACGEMERVAKPGALIAVGVTYEPTPDADSKIVGSMQSTAEGLSKLFPTPHTVHFSNTPNGRGPVMLIIRLNK